MASDFAEPFAKTVAGRVIGFDEADLPNLDHWTDILSVGTRQGDEGLQAGVEFFGFLGATLAQRASEPPREDLISVIIDGSVDGRPLSGDEQHSPSSRSKGWIPSRSNDWPSTSA